MTTVRDRLISAIVAGLNTAGHYDADEIAHIAISVADSVCEEFLITEEDQQEPNAGLEVMPSEDWK